VIGVYGGAGNVIQDAQAHGRVQNVVITTFGIILPLCRIAGFVFGLLAAYYWFKANRVELLHSSAILAYKSTK
jgi:hypothetical protein